VWAALDCPTSAPVANFGEGPAVVLARLTARVDHPVRVGEPYAIVSWPLDVDGRKRHAAAALFDADGRLLAESRALWIELRG
jgi:acyl-CoA thioesterase FadM